MEPRFTRGEYWLLENVVEDEFAIGALIDSDLRLHQNKKWHGLTHTALVETLHRLLASGLIYAKSEATGFISTHEQIKRALDEMKSTDEGKLTSYGLTEEGGVQWEAFASPDWQRYIKEGFQVIDGSEYGIWEVMCADKGSLESYFKSIYFHYPIEMSLASVAWDYIAPWQATYWKQLDGAYRLRFQARDEREAENAESSPQPSMEYFHSVWCAWR